MLPLQKVSQNTDDIRAFAKRIEELTAMLKDATDNGAALSKQMIERVDRLAEYVTYIMGRYIRQH